jgi:Calcineurin-like phosphoesterase
VRAILNAEQFVKAWNAAGCSPQTMSEQTGIDVRKIYARRLALEKKGIFLQTIARSHNPVTAYQPPAHFERWREFTITDGVAVVFSDAHYLPDHAPEAHAALEAVVRALKPQLIVANGDLVDGDTISRYDPTRGHHKRFTVHDELECVKLHLESLQSVAGTARLAWTLGNHDVRLSRFIATRAPELLDMPLTRLDDWFPAWPLSWAVMINKGGAGHTVIRHRNQAGMLHLQAQKAGAHYVHGHLHKLNVHRLATFAGTRYSVDTGSLADPSSEGFDYAEGGAPHAQGFAVLTYRNGRLLPPELCEIVDGVAYFRGAAV